MTGIPVTTRRRRRTRRPRATATPQQPPLRPEEARALAGELLRQLAPLATDRGAVRSAMLARLDAHGTANLGAICMVATQMIFAECMRPATIADAPPGSLEFDTEETT